MTAQEFLEAFAVQIGVPAPTAAQFEGMLQVAAVAAHASERVAAPLACWMGGLSGTAPAELLAAAERAAGGAEAG